MADFLSKKEISARDPVRVEARRLQQSLDLAAKLWSGSLISVQNENPLRRCALDCRVTLKSDRDEGIYENGRSSSRGRSVFGMELFGRSAFTKRVERLRTRFVDTE